MPAGRTAATKAVRALCSSSLNSEDATLSCACWQDRDDDVRAVAAEALLPIAGALGASGQHNTLCTTLWDLLLDLDELSPSTGVTARLKNKPKHSIRPVPGRRYQGPAVECHANPRCSFEQGKIYMYVHSYRCSWHRACVLDILHAPAQLLHKLRSTSVICLHLGTRCSRDRCGILSCWETVSSHVQQPACRQRDAAAGAPAERGRRRVRA